MFAEKSRKLLRLQEPVNVMNYLSVHKALRKDMRKKRYKKVYNYLLLHRPTADEHLILYYEVCLRCVFKLLHMSSIRKESQLDSVNRHCERGIAIAQQLADEMCSEGPVLSEKTVKPNILPHIDRLWAGLMDFAVNLSIGFKGCSKYVESLKCLQAADRIADCMVESFTQNAGLMGKACKIKMQLGVAYFEFGFEVVAIAYLEKALDIARDELTIRERKKFNNSRGELTRKQVKEGHNCKKTTLMLFIILALVYESLKVYDMVAFLISQARRLSEQFKTERNDGIYKILEKLESHEFLWRFEKYSNTLQELSAICHNLFDIAEIARNAAQRQSKPYLPMYKRPLNEQTIVEKPTIHISDVHFLGPNFLANKGQYEQQHINRPSINTINSQVMAEIEQKVEQQVSQSSLFCENHQSLQERRLSADKETMITQPTVSMAKLYEQLLNHLTKQDKTKQKCRNKSLFSFGKTPLDKRSSILTVNHSQSVSKQKDKCTEKAILMTTKQSEAQTYVNAYLQSVKSHQRFKNINIADRDIHRMNRQLQNTRNKIDYQKAKIRSRSRPRMSSVETPRCLSAHVPQAFSTKKPKQLVIFSHVAEKTVKQPDTPNTRKSVKQQISTNIQFQHLILRHKSFFGLNKLQAHCLRNRQRETKQDSKIRRMGRKISFRKSTQLIKRLNMESHVGITKLLQQLKVQPEIDKPTAQEDLALTLKLTPKLLLSYHQESTKHTHTNRPHF